MTKVIVLEFMSLDGVVQAPSYADEDTSGGFAHGGWHRQYLEERAMKWVVDTVSSAGGFLFGRRTYEGFAAAWPSREGEFADLFNSMPKYVVSTTLDSADWNNTTILHNLDDVLHVPRPESPWYWA